MEAELDRFLFVEDILFHCFFVFSRVLVVVYFP